MRSSASVCHSDRGDAHRDPRVLFRPEARAPPPTFVISTGGPPAAGRSGEIWLSKVFSPILLRVILTGVTLVTVCVVNIQFRQMSRRSLPLQLRSGQALSEAERARHDNNASTLNVICVGRVIPTGGPPRVGRSGGICLRKVVLPADFAQLWAESSQLSLEIGAAYLV